MRMLLAILIATVVCSATSTATAQTHLPVPVSPYMPWQPLWFTSYTPTFVPFDYSSHKLQLKPYASISTGFAFWNGGGMAYLSAPAGLMLIRPLNNNLAAFSTVSLAPTLWNPMYHDPKLRSPGYNLGLNARIEGGLIYTNDARTFSISGGVSIERGGYPMNPALSHPNNYTPKSY